MQLYCCDVCGRTCSRIHRGEAYGMDCSACDDCWDYDWLAYDEDADPLLYPDDPLEAAYEAREPHWRDTP